MSGAPFPLPDTGWEPGRGFFEAAARGALAVPRCTACGAWNWYPPERCRACDGPVAWADTAGRGTLFSWAVVTRTWVKEYAGLAPYVTGLVALEEDPAVRIVTRLVDCTPEELRMDMPVRAVFRPLRFPGLDGEVTAPFFTPAA